MRINDKMIKDKNLNDKFVSLMNRSKLTDLYSLLKSNVESFAAILVYHRVNIFQEKWSISTIEVKEFEKQMKYLKKSYNILDLEELVSLVKEKKAIPKKTVVITFDDGYLDNYKFAYPILKKYKIPATIFLTTGYIGSNDIFWWDKLGYILFNTKIEKIDLKDFGKIYPKSFKQSIQSFEGFIEKFKNIPDEKRKDLVEELIKSTNVAIPRQMGKDTILSWDQVKEMTDNGIKFGAHTVNHPILTQISLKNAEKEIVNSKKDIERHTSEPVRTFCYPNGLLTDFNSEIKQLLEENDFSCALTLLPKMVTQNSDLYELGRIPPGEDFHTFKYCLSGLYSDISQG
jgi:peptidoglycan/xylan/chitin deacetylase (PgdA/CDA1 family)